MDGVESSARKRARVGVDLTILALVGIVLIAALGAGGAVLYKDYYSPSAFVTRYLDLLSSGRAADALRVGGAAGGEQTTTRDSRPRHPRPCCATRRSLRSPTCASSPRRPSTTVSR